VEGGLSCWWLGHPDTDTQTHTDTDTYERHLEDTDGRADDGVAHDEDARTGGQPLGQVWYWWLLLRACVRACERVGGWVVSVQR
jgi:hypothetical protein